MRRDFLLTMGVGAHRGLWDTLGVHATYGLPPLSPPNGRAEETKKEPVVVSFRVALTSMSIADFDSAKADKFKVSQK